MEPLALRHVRLRRPELPTSQCSELQFAHTTMCLARPLMKVQEIKNGCLIVRWTWAVRDTAALRYQWVPVGKVTHNADVVEAIVA
jgi:hypothetical protein